MPKDKKNKNKNKKKIREFIKKEIHKRRKSRRKMEIESGPSGIGGAVTRFINKEKKRVLR